jgi:hypothetical protein
VAKSAWSIPMDALADGIKGKLDTVARKATLDLFSAVGLRSPVGNPELWKVNESSVAARQAYVTEALAFNAANPLKRRMGTGRRTVERKFPLVGGNGYVGGRFRANWNVSYGSPDGSITKSTEKGRVVQEAAKALTLPVGGVIYMTNGLPYAHRLEYEGWSKQAPAGMVRVSAVEFSTHVRSALKSL